MSIQSRPMLERLRKIKQLVEQGGYPNCNTMAETLEFSPRTLHRDIEFMRDRLELPLEYDAQNHGYYFDGDIRDFPDVTVQTADLIALFFANKVMVEYAGTGLERKLHGIFEKISMGLEGEVTISWQALDDLMSFKISGVAHTDVSTFQTLTEAVRNSHQVEIRYRKLGSKRAEKRLIDPHHLTSYNGLWYVIAFDNKRTDFRTFALSRVEGIQKTKRRFERRDEFNSEEYLRDSFGVFKEISKPQTVKIRFAPPISRIVKEREWHVSQRVKQLAGESVQLTFKVTSLTEVKNWVMSWGEYAEVIAPDSLRKEVAQSIRKMAALYRKK